MSTRRSHVGRHPSATRRELAALVRRAPRVPFGPTFFVTQLAAFLRDCCPAPEEGLPAVTLAMADGEVIDVCHVEALAARWLAVAAFEDRRKTQPPLMRTEIVPYESILRVTIRAVHVDGGIGFRADRAPAVVREAATERAVPQRSTLPDPGIGPRALPARGASGTRGTGGRPSGAGGTS